MNVGEQIYKLRTEQGMSQEALAAALNVSRQSVSKWENNSATPELEKLLAMSDVFGITLDQLVGREAPRPPASSGPEIVVQQTPPYRTLGIIFLCFGLTATLLLSILGGFVLGVMVGLPFVLLGAVLVVSTEGIFFKSAWVFFSTYAPLLFYFMLNFMGFGWGIRGGILVIWFTILILLSVYLHRKGKLSVDSKQLMVGSIIVALVLFLLLGIANKILYQITDLEISHEELVIDSIPMDVP